MFSREPGLPHPGRCRIENAATAFRPEFYPRPPPPTRVLNVESFFAAPDATSDVREFYDVDDDDVLGEGIQGIVRTVVNKKTGVKFAMKTVPKGAGKVRKVPPPPAKQARRDAARRCRCWHERGRVCL